LREKKKGKKKKKTGEVNLHTMTGKKKELERRLPPADRETIGMEKRGEKKTAAPPGLGRSRTNGGKEAAFSAAGGKKKKRCWNRPESRRSLGQEKGLPG